MMAIAGLPKTLPYDGLEVSVTAVPRATGTQLRTRIRHGAENQTQELPTAETTRLLGAVFKLMGVTMSTEVNFEELMSGKRTELAEIDDQIAELETRSSRLRRELRILEKAEQQLARLDGETPTRRSGGGAARSGSPSLIERVKQVLRDAGKAMHVKEIADRIGEPGRAGTLQACIGGSTALEKVGRGYFKLREQQAA
jgi:hypothetical protein